MLRLLRTSIATSAAAWAWRNRSDLIARVKAVAGLSDDEDVQQEGSTVTGYASETTVTP